MRLWKNIKSLARLNFGRRFFGDFWQHTRDWCSNQRDKAWSVKSIRAHINDLSSAPLWKIRGKIIFFVPQTERARVGSKQSTDSDFPRGYLHQQHFCNAIQKGKFRSWRCDLPCCDKVSRLNVSLFACKLTFFFETFPDTMHGSETRSGTARDIRWCSIYTWWWHRGQ